MPTLPRAETLLIEGVDAMAFAHAQFSGNIEQLAVGHWQFGAWLDAQGRLRALFHLARLAPDRLLLLLRGGDAVSMVDALRRYVFRSKLQLTAMPSRILSTSSAMPLHAVGMDTQAITLGCGSYSMHVSAEANLHDESWFAMQLFEGWAWMPERILGTLLPSALSLHRLQAVAIDKGCYPGQEIVARMHYRGGQKQHLHRVQLSRPASSGQPLHVQGREIGCLLNMTDTVDGTHALAILRDEAIAGLGDVPLQLDDGLALQVLASWGA